VTSNVSAMHCIGQTVNGHYDITLYTFLKLDGAGRRGHSKKLFKRRNRVDIRKYVFANRIVDNWNVLPDSCMECTTATGDLHTNFRQDQSSGSRDMLADRHTHTQTDIHIDRPVDHNTLHPYRGRVITVGTRRAGTKNKLGGAKGRGGGACGGGIPLPIRLGGLAERGDLPQRGPGRSPVAKRIWCILIAPRSLWWKRLQMFCSISSNAETVIIYI